MGALAHLLTFFGMLQEIAHSVDCGSNITNRNQDTRVVAYEDVPWSGDVARDGD